MKYSLTAKNVLQQLGITKCYSGYDYVLYGIDLIMNDEHSLSGITKGLYIDIAKKFDTSHTCVERNIRKIIEVIWKHSSKNHETILKFFGSGHINRKPSNKEFLQYICEYIELHSRLETIITADDFICPISNNVCINYHKIIKKLSNL